MVADELDASRKRLEQFEGDFLGRVISRVLCCRHEKRFLVSRPFAPTFDHVLGDAIQIGGDAQCETTAEGALASDVRQRLLPIYDARRVAERVCAIAVKQIFESGQALKGDALVGELIWQGRRIVAPG